MSLEFYVNGTLIREDKPDPNGLLVNYLRRKVGLTGTKVACGEGGCGSCTVVLSKFESQTQKFTHLAINACITPICSIHGCHILTIEGIGGRKSKSCHILQDAIAQGNGTQCGFCTPGMVMSMHGLVCSKTNPDIEDIKGAIQGNLCRCTGYRPILEAFRKCTKLPIQTNLDEECVPCLEDKRVVQLEADTNVPQIEDLLKSFHKSNENNNDLIFGTNNTWLQPNSMSKLVDILNTNPSTKIVGGSTELVMTPSVETNVFVYTGLIPEMRVLQVHGKYVRMGAAITISEMIVGLKNIIENLPVWEAGSLRTILMLVNKYGSTQIRNVATLGGSIMTNNVASDIQTLFSAFKCRVEYLSKDLKEKVIISAEKIDLNFTGVIIAFEIPLNVELQYSWAHKVMKRNETDAAILNFAIMVKLNDTLDEVKEASLSMGGKLIERFQLDIFPVGDQCKLSGDKFLKYMTTIVRHQLLPRQEISTTYCNTLFKNLCTKCCDWLKDGLINLEIDLNQGFKSTQIFDKTSESQSPIDLVGKPVPHSSAYKHSTGEAKYVDDIPKYKNELALEFVLSKRPHAFIKNKDFTKCLELEGVVGIVGHTDISSPDKNYFGLVVRDEEVFASEKVNCVGQIICGIVAKSRAIAKKAVELVQIEYEDIEPCIISIDDAIKYNSFYPDFGMTLESGNCEQDFPDSQTLTGTFVVGTQAHFYMEPQGCLVIPNGEDGELEVISSTQNPMDTQLQVANTVDVPANRIVVKVKRVGGGFGGKEARSLMVAIPVAVAAKKFGVPVRCILERQTDMLISGKRSAFQVIFSVTFNSSGQIFALRLKLHINAGHSLDVSCASLERAIMNVDNTYNIPNFQAEGFVCRTNTASNTVFRGTGAPQAALIIENILDLISSHLQSDPIKVRGLNLYSEGDVTPYGQSLLNSTIRRCWDECLQASQYSERLAAVNEFNLKNEWKKRGISINPAQYGVAYTALHLNQASALVHIYRDGSVLLSHGGVEIGQGLHSKMIQVATRELGISSDKIRIVETSTDKVPNATPTSASSSSDLNGMAVINACQKLIQRLQPYKLEEPNLSWEEIITKAYTDRTSLSATGYYKMPGIGWNATTKKGNPFNYYSTGVACTEIELDCLTGQHKILRTDIIMDVGQSLNPAIDLGQIEGAYMQGVGLYTMEELKLAKNGEVETLGPSSYKIPTVGDIPFEFNVSLLSGSSNPRAVYSSKGIGEPPLLLATSAFFAIKDAIRRKVKSSVFELNSPATVEQILMALQHN